MPNSTGRSVLVPLRSNFGADHINCDDGFGAHIVRNGISIYDANVHNGGSTSFIRHILTLSAGDLVDFVVEPGPNGDQDCDPTSLKVKVKLIPCVTAR